MPTLCLMCSKMGKSLPDLHGGHDVDDVVVIPLSDAKFLKATWCKMTM